MYNLTRNSVRFCFILEIRPRTNMCGSGYPTYPKFFTSYPYFFASNSEVGREKQNKIILFCYSLPASEFGEKI